MRLCERERRRDALGPPFPGAASPAILLPSPLPFPAPRSPPNLPRMKVNDVTLLNTTNPVVVFVQFTHPDLSHSSNYLTSGLLDLPMT